jgi:Xaa-Pro aminopeptidase
LEENIVREKLAQAVEILDEQEVDLWMLMARESDVMGDPSLPLVVGTSVTWESAFLVSRSGDHVAIVGTGDVANIEATGAWDNVIGYVEGISGVLREEIKKRDPNVIALNYSTDDNMADGLSHGMFLLLQDILKDTPYFERVRGAEDIPRKVRARKSPTELRRIRQAVQTTERIWEATERIIRPGITERDISDFMHGQLEERRIGSSWDWKYCPTVTAGPDSPVGHVPPSDIAVKAGQLVSIDFGVNEDEYSSDMQRTFYVLGPDETEAPEEVRAAFSVIDRCIQEASQVVRPGVPGWTVDQVAREIFEEEGMETWQFALGHQMGRACHDGGTLLGPRWERYGERPNGLIEEGEVYTLEIGCPVEGYGFVSLEEDVVVTSDGCEFLAPPQRELILIQP